FAHGRSPARPRWLGERSPARVAARRSFALLGFSSAWRGGRLAADFQNGSGPILRRSTLLTFDCRSTHSARWWICNSSDSRIWFGRSNRSGGGSLSPTLGRAAGGGGVSCDEKLTLRATDARRSVVDFSNSPLFSYKRREE